MRTEVKGPLRGTAAGAIAENVIGACVHCGMCNGACPTFRLTGDELDGPRGRIYLIKQLLEGAEVTESTQLHLDRCLTCRNCETTCPSGVEYGRLLDIGRKLVDERVGRPAAHRALRWLLKEGLTSALFAPALKVGRLFRPWLPTRLRDKIPPARRGAVIIPTREHARKVLLFEGCVQPAMIPSINEATVRVLDAAGIQSVRARGAGCCGALRSHLSDPSGGLTDMRRNIDAWWPLLSTGAVECIVVNASGCSHMIKEYAHALRHEPAYAAKAARVAALTRDLCELLPEIGAALRGRIRAEPRRLALHPPCTLQHGQRLSGVAYELGTLGFDVRVPLDGHLCCGSAGGYSLLQPALAYELRDRKLGQIAALEPECIVSANIGCIQHLQSGTSTPVRHWVEVLDAALLRATAVSPETS
jgi:glycolate oxidase iron-sulfur subunit